MTTRAISLFLVAAAMIGCSTTPVPHNVNVRLTGTEEVPPVSTSATGAGEIVVTPERLVSGTIVVTGMEPTVAHIHVGAPGQNGPPIVTLGKSGAYTFVVPAGSTLTEAQYADYRSGNLYVNVHSAAHPNGEIRVQLKPYVARRD
jgi:hypothetical protein